MSEQPETELKERQSIVIGRYLLHRQIARGGMATIHIARLVGDEGFSRIVAAKRLHPEFAEDAEFVSMFLDEAHIASKVHHRNVVPVLDVITTGEEVVLVQEYVHGVPLHWLLRTAHEAKTHIPINVAVSIACQVLAGLQAAHETVDEIGTPLHVVHRDVSPQNIMVATDGTARLLDFGIAKATMAAHITREGMFKGKLAYSAPEQIRGQAIQQSDIYSLAVVLWELLVGHRLHHGAQSEAELIGEIMQGRLPTITEVLASEREWLGSNRWRQLEALEPIIQKGLNVDVVKRYQTASALASAWAPASTSGVAGWLKTLGRDFLAGRDRVIAAEEASWRRTADLVPRRVSGLLRPITEPGTQPAHPPAEVEAATKQRRTRAIVGVAATAFVAMICLIVWLARDPDVEVAASAKPAVTEPPPAHTTPPPPRDETVAVQPTAPPPVVGAETADTTAAALTTSTPTPPIIHPTPAHVAAPTARGRAIRVVRPPPAPTPIAKPPPQAVAKTAAPPPAPVQKPAAPLGPEPTKLADCNPPYYFEGSKKVFKPACL
jgi:serine/threonine-protein kinase